MTDASRSAEAGPLGRMTQDLRRAAAERAGAARDWAADQSDVLRDTVQTKPFASVGVLAVSTFAAGFALGVLVARR